MRQLGYSNRRGIGALVACGSPSQRCLYDDTQYMCCDVPCSAKSLQPVVKPSSSVGPASSQVAGLCAGYDWVSARLLFTRFWHRLFGTAAIWFCNDWCGFSASCALFFGCWWAQTS